MKQKTDPVVCIGGFNVMFMKGALDAVFSGPILAVFSKNNFGR